MPTYATRPMDWLKIAIVAYVAVKVVNYGLDRIGKPEFKV